MTWLDKLRAIRGRRPEAEALLCQQLQVDGLDARLGCQNDAACAVAGAVWSLLG
jgi:hypothetical protein